jgi:hypothetical protein
VAVVGRRSSRSHLRDFGMNSERPAWVTREWLCRAALAASAVTTNVQGVGTSSGPGPMPTSYPAKVSGHRTSSQAQGMTSPALGQARSDARRSARTAGVLGGAWVDGAGGAQCECNPAPAPHT